MKTLKQLAKEFYLDKVKVEAWRENFLKALETKQVVDKRDLGYYCYYCKQFNTKKEMGGATNDVINKRDVDEIWIVNTHYDGCKGWD